MEQLIALLMDNILYVIIAVGALLSFFGKSDAKKKGNSRMPTFGGDEIPGNRPQEREVQRPVPTSVPEPVRLSNLEERVYAEEYVEEIRPVLPARTEPRPARSTARPAIGTSNAANRTANAVSVKAEDLRNAVIWSEILGPPRAKRSHRK